MVSRQETARPLLTPGEVMQLTPDEALVLVSGAPPIRARKLRYFQDRNFTARVVSPPDNLRTDPDRPPHRPDDWTGLFRRPDAALSSPLGQCKPIKDEGGPSRHPGFEAQVVKPPFEPDPLDRLLGDDDDQVEVKRLDALARDVAKRAFGVDQSDDDLLPSF